VSTWPFAITVSRATVNRNAAPHATNFFVRLSVDSWMMCFVILWAEFMTILAAAARSGH